MLKTIILARMISHAIFMFGPCGLNILSFVWISMFLIFYVRALSLLEFLSDPLQTRAQSSLGM